jgi:dCMP deaminase
MTWRVEESVADDTWDLRFLALAETVAGWSKDPSTRVGAVIVDAKRRVVGLGYNGFPRGIADTERRLTDREQKYKMVVHAEANAILNATARVDGCTLYVWPVAPCSGCAKLVIQSGIERVVSIADAEAMERWGDDIRVAHAMFLEAGLRVELL